MERQSPAPAIFGLIGCSLSAIIIRDAARAGGSEADAIAEGHRVATALKEHGVGTLDLAELKDRLRHLATDYRNANMRPEDDALTAILRNCLG